MTTTNNITIITGKKQSGKTHSLLTQAIAANDATSHDSNTVVIHRHPINWLVEHDLALRQIVRCSENQSFTDAYLDIPEASRVSVTHVFIDDVVPDDLVNITRLANTFPQLNITCALLG